MRGPLIRISPQLEEMVRRTAEELGVKPSDVRNMAILLGLAIIMWNYHGDRIVKEMQKIAEKLNQ